VYFTLVRKRERKRNTS